MNSAATETAGVRPGASSARFLPWLGATLLYTGVTLLYAWRLLPALASSLPSDLGDPPLNAWIMWWNAQVVPFTERWWNAPMFFPMPGALALSETLLGLTWFTTPLLWAGLSPVVTHNTVFLLSFPTAALAAHALARHLTGRHDVAIIAGLAFGFSPYRAAHLPQVQLLVAFWLPLALLALHRFIEGRRHRDLALAAGCWLGAGLTSGYFLMFLAVLIGLWMVMFVRRWIDWVTMLAAFGAAGVAMIPLILGYRERLGALGLTRTFEEIEHYSPDLTAIWAASRRGDLLSMYWTIEPFAEGELYPGIVILALAAAGTLAAWFAKGPGRRLRLQVVLSAGGLLACGMAVLAALTGGFEWTIGGVTLSATRPYRSVSLAVWLFGAALLCDRRVIDGWCRRSPFMFYGLAAGIMLLCALGPVPRVFDARFMYQAPYRMLMELPGGDALRVPARFLILFMLCLGQAAAISLARFTPRGARPALIAALGLVVMLDGYMLHMPVERAPQQVDLASTNPKSVVLEVPMLDGYNDSEALLRSSGHGRPVVNGYSGYVPRHFLLLHAGLVEKDRTVLNDLQRRAPVTIIVNRDRKDGEAYVPFLDDWPEAERVRYTDTQVIYGLPPRPPVAMAGGSPLSITAVTATGNRDLEAFMIDGDPATSWRTSKNQTAGDAIIVTLDRPATITRIEFDLGRSWGDYPRRLRVDVGDEAPRVVWDSGMAGHAVRAALEDFERMTIRVTPWEPVEGRRVVLTLVEGHAQVEWTVAELRVFGAVK